MADKPEIVKQIQERNKLGGREDTTQDANKDPKVSRDNHHSVSPVWVAVRDEVRRTHKPPETLQATYEKKIIITNQKTSLHFFLLS